MRKAIVLAGVLLACSSALAVENTALLESNATVKKYQRKTAVGVGNAVYQSTSVSFTFKDNTKKGKAGKILSSLLKSATGANKFTYQITPPLIEGSSKELYDFIITQRFDKLLLLNDKVILITKTKEFVLNQAVPLPKLPQGESFGEFKRNVEDYLNKNVAPIMQKLLEVSMSQRYKELPEREKMTFITQKAKELGIPLEVAERLMNTGFAFAAYVPTLPTGSLSVEVGPFGKYSANMKMQYKVRVLSFKFDPDSGKFKFYREFDGDSGVVGESLAVPSVYYTPQPYRPLFEKTFLLASKAAAINVNMKLKQDDNFAIFSVAEDVRGREFGSKIGVAESIRMDEPFSVYEYVNGKRKFTGFAKVRQVAFNCEDESKKSKFELIKGKVSDYDQLREYPWTGVLFGVEVGSTTYKINKLDIYDADGGGTWATLRIYVDADLGYLLNSKALSEIWLKAFAGAGSGGDDVTLYNFLGFNVTMSPDGYYEAGAGINKRFYVMSTGLSIAPGLDAAYRYLKFSGVGGELKINAFSVIPNLGINYSFSPKFELNAEVGYVYDVSSSVSYTDWLGTTYSWSAETEGGPEAFIGLSYHFGVVGSLAKLFVETPHCPVKKVKLGGNQT